MSDNPDIVIECARPSSFATSITTATRSIRLAGMRPAPLSTAEIVPARTMPPKSPSFSPALQADSYTPGSPKRAPVGGEIMPFSSALLSPAPTISRPATSSGTLEVTGSARLNSPFSLSTRSMESSSRPISSQRRRFSDTIPPQELNESYSQVIRLQSTSHTSNVAFNAAHVVRLDTTDHAAERRAQEAEARRVELAKMAEAQRIEADRLAAAEETARLAVALEQARLEATAALEQARLEDAAAQAAKAKRALAKTEKARQGSARREKDRQETEAALELERLAKEEQERQIEARVLVLRQARQEEIDREKQAVYIAQQVERGVQAFILQQQQLTEQQHVRAEAERKASEERVLAAAAARAEERRFRGQVQIIMDLATRAESATQTTRAPVTSTRETDWGSPSTWRKKF